MRLLPFPRSSQSFTNASTTIKEVEVIGKLYQQLQQSYPTPKVQGVTDPQALQNNSLLIAHITEQDSFGKQLPEDHLQAIRLLTLGLIGDRLNTALLRHNKLDALAPSILQKAHAMAHHTISRLESLSQPKLVDRLRRFCRDVEEHCPQGTVFEKRYSYGSAI